MNHLARSHITRLALLWVAMVPETQAQVPFTEDYRFEASVGQGCCLGISVTIEDDMVLIGRYSAVHVFREQSPLSWVEAQVLLPLSAYPCGYGKTVVLDQRRVAVGDPDHGGFSFCDRDGWLYAYSDDGVSLTTEGPQSAQLTPPFGSGVASGFTVDLDMAGDWLLAGADGYVDDGPDSWPVAVFFRWVDGAWQQRQVVSGSGTVMFLSFGISVGLNETGTLAVVGDPEEQAAYVFAYDGVQWTEVQRLAASDSSTGDGFGQQVAIHNGVVAVGAPGDDGQFVDQGSVYLFSFDGSSWVEVQNFSAPTPVAGAAFGNSIDLKDGRLAVGAPGDLYGYSVAESAFVYRDFGGAFRFVQSLDRSMPSGDDNFGGSIQLDGPRCLVGASTYGNPVNTGAAFLYELHDLALTTASPQVQAGQTLTIVTRGGIPGTPCQVTLGLQRRGSSGLAGPLFGAPGAIQGVFNAEGRCAQTLSLPLGLAGKTLELRTHGLIEPGVADVSNPVTITVL